MNGERLKFRDKTFSSLNRSKRKIGNSPIPINKLTDNGGNSNESSPEKKNEIFRGSAWGAIDRSRKIREQLMSEVELKRSKESRNTYSFENNEDEDRHTEDAENNGVEKTPKTSSAKPAVVMVLTTVEYNGTLYESDAAGRVELHMDDDLMFFRKRKSIIDEVGLIYIRHIREFKVGNHKILFILRKRAGYLLLSYQQEDAHIQSYIKDVHPELYDSLKYLNSEITKLKDLVVTAMEPKTNKLVEKSENSHSSDLNRTGGRISPNTFYGSRATRSQTKTIIDTDTDSDALTIREKPASFTPPLKYKFKSNKVFSINHSDFKTLYNNDWINDSIIDFFIQYEIEKAVYDRKLFKADDIYAFNSFFFTKLMEKKEVQDDGNYYQNIKRWLNRVDLMSYPCIVIPINENAHWYCCIIRGLPQLLEQAKRNKEEELNENGNVDEITKEDEKGLKEEGNDTERSQDSKMEISVVESQDSVNCIEDTGSFDFSMNAEPRKIVEKPKPTKADIFVFDSLSQKHTNIHFPLKKVIIDYCQDKFGLEIKKEFIRVQNAKVPKQNNFNDCGIHVIYNVRKWLNDNSGCEKLWKSFGSKHATRLFFIAKERNNMRKELIDLLLELHKKHSETLHNSPQDPKDNSEDDIEVIEYTPEKRCDASSEGGKSESPETKNTDTAVDIPYTLDPNASSTIGVTSSIKNEALKRITAGAPLSIPIVNILNNTFPKKNVQIGSRILLKIKELVEGLEKESTGEDLNQFETVLREIVSCSNAARPRDTSFRIEHDKGVTESAEMNGSDSFNEDLSNLNLSDIGEPNASSRHGDQTYSSSRMSILESLKSPKKPKSDHESPNNANADNTDTTGSTKRRRID